MNKEQALQLLSSLSNEEKASLLESLNNPVNSQPKEKQSIAFNSNAVQKHIVFECRITKPNGQYAIGKVMIEPADQMFVTRARARGAGRRKFGKNFMYIIGLEEKQNLAILEPVLQQSLF